MAADGATHRAWLWSYLYPRRWAIARVMSLALLATAIGVLTPWITKHIIDEGLIARDEQALLFWVSMMLLIALASAILGAINRRSYLRLSSTMLMAMRRDTFAYLGKLSPTFHLKFGQGNLLSRLDADLGEVQRYALDSLLAGTNGILALFGALIMMYLLSPQLLLIAFVLLPLSVIFLKIMRPRLESNTRLLRERSTDVSSLLIDRLPNIRLLQAFLAVDSTVSQLDVRQDRYRDQLLRSQLLGYWVATVPGLFNSVATGAVFVFGGYAVIQNELSLGVLIAFATYLGRATGPVNGFLGLYVATQRARVSLVRVHELLDEKPQVLDPEHPKALAEGPGRLRLSSVQYGYSPGRSLWSPLSATIPGSSRVWVQGPSGGGKSSLLSLMQRHANPDAGSIELDGVRLDELSLADLRHAICWLDQDAPMLDASVRDNLTLGEGFDDAALQMALDRASLSAWLSGLPQGLETRIGHRGARLSGGERHRLALARIFLRKPRVLLFDETTASLDAHLAAKIWSTVEHLFPGQTLIIASHQRPDLHGLTHHLQLSGGVWTSERM